MQLIEGEVAAEHGLHADGGEKISDDHQAGDGERIAVAGELEVIGAGESEVAGDVLEGIILTLEFFVAVHGIGGAGHAGFGVSGGDENELLRIVKRKRAEEDGVDDAEDGDIGADAEGENDDGDGYEGAVAAEGAEGVAQVLGEFVEEWESARVAMLLLGLLGSAEADERVAAGFFGRHAALDIFFDCELKVSGYFGVEVGVELLAVKKRAQAL